MLIEINNSTVEVRVYDAEGREVSTKLTPLELQTVSQLDWILRSNTAFQAAYPQARLKYLESMRGLADSEAGRYYLRYRSPKLVVEFWGCVREQPLVDLDEGLVAVRRPDSLQGSPA